MNLRSRPIEGTQADIRLRGIASGEDPRSRPGGRAVGTCFRIWKLVSIILPPASKVAAPLALEKLSDVDGFRIYGVTAPRDPPGRLYIGQQSKTLERVLSVIHWFVP